MEYTIIPVGSEGSLPGGLIMHGCAIYITQTNLIMYLSAVSHNKLIYMIETIKMETW